MTSKQLINQLCYEYNTKNYNEEKLKTTQKIKKDLEVLEILKNKNVDVDLIKNIMKDNRKFEYYPDDNLTQEEFNKIKTWLENE